MARRSGDYNEKSFLDIATFGEIWEWVEGVLKEGLFSASDEDGNAVIMLYNRMVGAVRRRRGTRSLPLLLLLRVPSHTPVRDPAHASDRAPPSHLRRCGCASCA